MTDGLVFYDQFTRLRPHQIALVSIGVALLLLGVWVVSVIQPTNEVELGTWAEDEDAEDVMTDTTGILAVPYTDEPASAEIEPYPQPTETSPLPPASPAFLLTAFNDLPSLA